MGDENTILTDADARHMLRRATFGAPRRVLDDLGLVGQTRGQAADTLLAIKQRPFAPGGPFIEIAQSIWTRNLVKGKRPVQDKLALFWHDHFSVAYSKVQEVKLMKLYVKLLYTHGMGNFKEFVKEMNRNVGMMEFLDTVRNFKAIPNENYPRELCELFTLGVVDLAGNPNYTQADIVQIARAFTGWNRTNNRDRFFEEDHDFTAEFPERGPKVLFPGAHGFPAGGAAFDAAGEGEQEIDEVIEILFAHQDTDGENTVARRTARRLLEYYAHADPTLQDVDDVIAASSFDTAWDVSALLRAIWTHDVFYETAAPAPFGAGTRKSVKWPIDFFVGTLRLLDMKMKGREQVIQGGSYITAHEHMTNLGQSLLDPPSVFGWDWEDEWFSTSTLLARYVFARDVGAARDGGKRLKLDKLLDFDMTDPGVIVDAVLDLLDVTHHVDAAERTSLIDYLTENGAFPVIDLNQWFFHEVKLRGLVALVIQCPGYQFH